MSSALLSGEDIIRSLYKSLSSCAEHHDVDLINQIHITTSIEDTIVLAAKKGKVVIITGNPGDGKTHLIRKVGNEFPKKVTVNKDANECEDDEIIKSIEKAISTKKGLILAINEGILLDICEKARKRSIWAEKIIESILKPYVYEDGAKKELDQIVVLDLNLRNNLSLQVVEQALDRIIALVDKKSNSPLLENVTCLKNPVVRQRLIHLLDAVARTGFHATMRDLLGFIAYLICGGEDESAGVSPSHYYLNAFVGGHGTLFDHVREFDPVSIPTPFLDYRLYTVQDEEQEWEMNPPYELREKENLSLFQERKRRAYFEHKLGDKIMRPERSDVDRYFEQMKKKDQSPEQVAVRLLNRFFDAKDNATDNLTLWVRHQFSAKPTRYVASRQTVNANDLEIKVPELPSHLAETFRDHYPDHVILKHKQMTLDDGLVIDRRLIRMLIAGDRQAGIGSRSLEAHSKIAAFYDRIARVCTNQSTIVQVLRLDNMNKAKIGVDISTREYFIPGG